MSSSEPTPMSLLLVLPLLEVSILYKRFETLNNN